jgi:FMN phosphatase YigB (HAD superfamily)
MIKAIIFDCFGVVISDTLQSTYEILGGDFYKDLDDIREILRSSDSGEINSSHAGIAELLGVSESTYTTEISSGREVNQELLYYINNTLRKKYKVGMLSNVGRGRLPEIFGFGFLERFFDTVIASGDVGFAKPEARAYEISADSLGVRLDECIFIDDRPEYIEGAQHVGMKTILYKDFDKFKKQLDTLLNE